MSTYADFATPEEVDRQYIPSSPAGNDVVFDGWATRSATARRMLQGRCDVAYGSGADEYLDIFPSGNTGSPVHIFIHGGFWYKFSVKDFSFIAALLVERGVTVVLNNYSLCPSVRIDDIVAQCRAAVDWVKANIAEFGGDPENVSLSGHSAGAQLATMVTHAAHPRSEADRTAPLRGVCGVSGLYDLSPMRFTVLQRKLKLTADQAERNSPLFHLYGGGPPAHLFVGEGESTEYHRQSEMLCTRIKALGMVSTKSSIPSMDHFSILDGFLEAGSAINTAIGRLAGLS